MRDRAETPDGPRQQLRDYAGSLVALGRGRLAAIVVLVIIGSLLESVGIILLIPMLGLIFAGPASGTLQRMIGDRLGDFTQSQQVGALVTLFAVLLFLRALVVWQRDLRLTSLSADLVDAWRARIVHAVAGASWRQLQELRPSQIEFAVTSEVGRLSAGSDRLLRGTVAAMQLVVQILLALYLSPLLCLIALASGLLGLPLLRPLIGAALRHGEEMSSDGKQRQHTFSEFLAGMKLAKAHDAEARYADSYNAQSTAMRTRAMAYFDAQLRSHNAFQLVSGLAAAALLLIGLLVTHTQPAVLSALLVLLARIAGPAQQLALGAQAVLNMLPAVGNLTALVARLGESSEKSAAIAAPRDRPGGPAGLAFKNLGYCPPGRGTPVLAGASGTLLPGEFAVLLGPSGSGKTTLADILLGLIAPDAGSLSLDGQPVTSEADRTALRRQTGYVPQDPFLFDQTIRGNMLWAAPEADDAQLWSALGQAEADAFVRALPQGLDTAVGNRGSRLSGGERQRLCLARALIARPRLLILDEASNALDREVEDRLLETLAHLRGTLTILMITHRLPPGLPVDRTWRLADGRLSSV